MSTREKTCGIYGIKNIVNNKIYIGSSKDIKTRWSGHKHFLRGKNLEQPTHKNIYLQQDWDKYKESSFQFIVLEECEPEILLEREQYWMDTTDLELYNVTDAIRDTLPQEMRDNISKGRKGIVFSDEHIKALSKAHKGRSYSEAQTKAHVGKHDNKLTYELACDIRKEYKAGGVTQKQLADKYGVSGRTIFDIIHNKYHKERQEEQ